MSSKTRPRGVLHLVSVSLLLLATDVAAQPAAQTLAEAMEIPAAAIESATLGSQGAGASVRVASNWGFTNTPRAGASLLVLSTGTAADALTAGHVAPVPGTNFVSTTADPFVGLAFS